MFVVGAQLALVKSAHAGFIPTTYCMLVRFLVMPGLSLLFVFLTAGRGWYTNDRLVWCAAFPCGVVGNLTLSQVLAGPYSCRTIRNVAGKYSRARSG